MKIQQISNFTNITQNNFQVRNNNYNNFGLIAKQTLSKDTVSFKEAKFPRKSSLNKIAQRIKKLESKKAKELTEGKKTKSDSKTNNQTVVKLPEATIKSILSLYQQPHIHFKTHLETTFAPLVAEGKAIISALPKSSFSISEKAQALELTTKNEIIKNIEDISRGRIIVETEDGFENVVKLFSKFLKKGNFKVIDFENHRLPAKDLGNGNFTSNDAFTPTLINRLKQIAKNTNEELQTKDMDSKVGYSGIHATLQDENGYKHELQIMTKAMHKVKEPEDLLYKIKAGKALQPRYQNRLYPKLKLLRPTEDIEILTEDKKTIKQTVFKDTMDKVEPEIVTDEIKDIRKKVLKYTKDAYKYALEHPFTENVLPAPEGLEKFDFARIFNEMLQCK